VTSLLSFAFGFADDFAKDLKMSELSRLMFAGMFGGPFSTGLGLSAYASDFVSVCVARLVSEESSLEALVGFAMG